ncbi:MAG: IclR family transcriptional regulator, partial [Amylibacter sp.]|nr:IclR family transcriptional regulator [Amylibacter sp.]
SLPPAARRAFVTGLDLKPLTDKTHTNPLSLLEELAETRKRGYALDNEEFMEGMVAIAVPVTDPDGRYVASLATHGPSQRFTIEKAVAERSILVESAERIQQILFD